MSRKVSINSLSNEELDKISNDLQICQPPSKYAFNTNPTYICLYEVEGDDLYIPFSYSRKYKRPPRKFYPKQEIDFYGHLRENQKEVKSEAISQLNKYGSTIIAAACGYGKTAMAIFIATKIKMKTLVICHRIVLIKQWKISIAKFCPKATVQVLTAKSAMKDVDFYIMNATNVPKHTKEFYSKIGFLIVDEAHLIMADKLSYCMRSIVPRYVLGLSATPYRTDGLNTLLDMYFGTRKIVRELWRKHIVYRINTGIKPKVKLNRMGKVDWGSVLESQAYNVPRNEMIIRIIKYFRKRVFLVLCKRVDQANYLVKRLKEEGEDVTSLIGKNQEYEQNSRILVGTVSKVGVGFDHPRLDSLILASDIQQYFVQYLGRVFRREDVEPYIFDIVDNHGLLVKHFRTRSSVYLKHGGVIKNFFESFPKFK